MSRPKLVMNQDDSVNAVDDVIVSSWLSGITPYRLTTAIMAEYPGLIGKGYTPTVIEAQVMKRYAELDRQVEKAPVWCG